MLIRGMLQILNQIPKKLTLQIAKSFFKTGLFLVLFAYWGLILVGTFLQFN